MLVEVPGDCEAADLDGDIGAVGRFNVVDSKGGAMQARYPATVSIPPPRVRASFGTKSLRHRIGRRRAGGTRRCLCVGHRGVKQPGKTVQHHQSPSVYILKE